jgi:peptidoglycan/xylan/chitin deacetylase (PgdA/CDA1 family)
MTDAPNNSLPPTRLHSEFIATVPNKIRARWAARDLALRALSLTRRVDRGGGWIRFPYYHHVFDDERTGFARQLDYFARFGEFISLSDAVKLLESDDPIDGCYFCITFDDGFSSCLSGATPILAERDIPALFYLVTGVMGRSLAPDDAIARDVFAFAGRGTTLDFLSWDDCRDMARAGMSFGSHTASHARLATLGPEAVERELRESKKSIENELDQACEHFCAPYGISGHDFDPIRDTPLASAAGYRSFATGTRGAMRQGGDPMSLKRDHIVANWGNHQLHYFLSMP